MTVDFQWTDTEICAQVPVVLFHTSVKAESVENLTTVDKVIVIKGVS